MASSKAVVILDVRKKENKNAQLFHRKPGLFKTNEPIAFLLAATDRC